MTSRYTYTKLLFTIILLVLAGCLKKDNIPDLTKVDPVIEFPIGGPGLKKNMLSAPATGVVDTVVALNIASPDPLGKDVTVTISADPATVAQYNSANGANYSPLPNNLYELESTTITIKAGYRVGRIHLKIKFNQFNPAQQYMLALSITNAPGCVISANFGKFLWAFVVQ